MEMRWGLPNQSRFGRVLAQALDDMEADSDNDGAEALQSDLFNPSTLGPAPHAGKRCSSSEGSWAR